MKCSRKLILTCRFRALTFPCETTQAIMRAEGLCRAVTFRRRHITSFNMTPSARAPTARPPYLQPSLTTLQSQPLQASSVDEAFEALRLCKTLPKYSFQDGTSLNRYGADISSALSSQGSWSTSYASHYMTSISQRSSKWNKLRKVQMVRLI